MADSIATAISLSLGDKFFGSFECNPARVSHTSPTTSIFEDCQFKIGYENSQRCRNMGVVVDVFEQDSAVACVSKGDGRFVCGLKSSSPEAHAINVEHGVTAPKVPDIVRCMPEGRAHKGVR